MEKTVAPFETLSMVGTRGEDNGVIGEVWGNQAVKWRVAVWHAKEVTVNSEISSPQLFPFTTGKLVWLAVQYQLQPSPTFEEPTGRANVGVTSEITLRNMHRSSSTGAYYLSNRAPSSIYTSGNLCNVSLYEFHDGLQDNDSGGVAR